MSLTNKDKKYILDNYPKLSAKQIARELKAKPRDIRAFLEENGSQARSAEPAESFFIRYAPASPLAIMILVAVISVVYLNSVRNGFHYDDIHSLTQNLGVQVEWTKNPESRNLFWRYFVEPELFSSRPKVGMTRPILMVTFALNYMWSRYEPWSWIFVNIALHMVNSIIIYIALCHLSGRPRAALLAALIFAVHPVNTETVNYINCRSESLGVFFMLLTIYFFSRSLREGRRSFRIASFVFFAIGLLTKELVFVTPALIAVLDFLFIHPAEKDRKPLEQRLLVYAPFIVLMGGFLFYRHLVMGVIGSENQPRPYSDNFVTQARVLFTYIRLFFFPIHQNISYENLIYTVGDLQAIFPMIYVKISSLFQSPEQTAELWNRVVHSDKTLGQVLGVYASILTLAGLAALALAWRRKHPLVTFVISVFFITLSITSVVPLNAIMNEHRLYLPSLGFSLLLAGWIENVATRLEQKRKNADPGWPLPVQAIYVVVVLSFVSLTVARNFTWHTDLTVWRNSTRNSPEKAQVVSDLGNAYYRIGRSLTQYGEIGIDGKIDRADRIVINQTFYTDMPEGPITRQTQDTLDGLFEKGLTRSEQLYKWAIRVEPSYYKAWHNLGTISYTFSHLAKQRNNLEAEREYLEDARLYFMSAIEIYKTGETFNDLGSTMLRLNELENDEEKKRRNYLEIENLYGYAIKYNPELPKAYVNRGRARIHLRKYEESIPDFINAIRLYPFDPVPYRYMGFAHAQLGQYQEAIKAYQECLKVNPKEPYCNKELKELERQMGR